MCMGGSPKIDPPQSAPPPPPPPPPPPVQDINPVQSATDPTRVADKKVKGRDALRIDRATANPVGSTGLNIPT